MKVNGSRRVKRKVATATESKKEEDCPYNAMWMMALTSGHFHISCHHCKSANQ